jgi:transcriptional regulator with XRE-family HTH domain
LVKISIMANLDTPGARLKALRTDRGMTGLALAQALDVTKSTISYWEAGRTELPWAICLALEALYGVSARWLAHGEDPMWLAAPRGSQALSRELIRIPFLSRDLGFTRTGQVVAPHPDSPALTVPAALLAEILGERTPNAETLFLWRTNDSEMAPHIPSGAWVLLDVSPDACNPIKDHGIYLLRLSPDQAPILRRLARDPLSGDLLVACDAPSRVPLRLDHRAKRTGWVVLASACWAGTTLP